MVALGVITLVLLVFSLIYYSYLANNSDRDVSFFVSVSLILLVMNLATNASEFFGIAFLYLIVSVLFIGLGFAVDKDESIAFYKSIGPWFKDTFTNTGLIGWEALSMIVFPAGITLYFVWYKNKPALARRCGGCSLWGILIWALLLWAILGLAL